MITSRIYYISLLCVSSHFFHWLQDQILGEPDQNWTQVGVFDQNNYHACFPEEAQKDSIDFSKRSPRRNALCVHGPTGEGRRTRCLTLGAPGASSHVTPPFTRKENSSVALRNALINQKRDRCSPCKRFRSHNHSTQKQRSDRFVTTTQKRLRAGLKSWEEQNKALFAQHENQQQRSHCCQKSPPPHVSRFSLWERRKGWFASTACRK